MVVTNVLAQTANRRIKEQKGIFSVIEYLKDLSVNPASAQTNYFMSEMGFRRKQVAAELRIKVSSSRLVLCSGHPALLRRKRMSRASVTLPKR